MKDRPELDDAGRLPPLKKKRRSFAIFAFAAGVLLILLEIDSIRRGGGISWFWIIVAVVAIVMGLMDMTARREEP